MQYCPKPYTREQSIKIRMNDFGETQKEAEDMIDWIEHEFSEKKLRPAFRKMLQNGDLL